MEPEIPKDSLSNFGNIIIDLNLGAQSGILSAKSNLHKNIINLKFRVKWKSKPRSF